MPVYVDIYNDAKGVAGKYNIVKVPNFVFAKADGEQIELYAGVKEARALIERIREIAKKYKRDLAWEESFEKAQEKAKEGKRIAVLFLDRDTSLVSALLDDSLKELLKKFVFVGFSPKENADAAKKYKVSRVPTLLVLDAEGEELLRIEGKKSVKELKAALEKLAKG